MSVREHIASVLNKRIKIDKVTSQASLASSLDVSESAVSKMMRTGQIDIDNILKLCELIMVSPNELLGYDENPVDHEVLDIINSDPELKKFILSRRANK